MPHDGNWAWTDDRKSAQPFLLRESAEVWIRGSGHAPGSLVVVVVEEQEEKIFTPTCDCKRAKVIDEVFDAIEKTYQPILDHTMANVGDILKLVGNLHNVPPSDTWMNKLENRDAQIVERPGDLDPAKRTNRIRRVSESESI